MEIQNLAHRRRASKWPEAGILPRLFHFKSPCSFHCFTLYPWVDNSNAPHQISPGSQHLFTSLNPSTLTKPLHQPGRKLGSNIRPGLVHYLPALEYEPQDNSDFCQICSFHSLLFRSVLPHLLATSHMWLFKSNLITINKVKYLVYQLN